MAQLICIYYDYYNRGIALLGNRNIDIWSDGMADARYDVVETLTSPTHIKWLELPARLRGLVFQIFMLFRICSPVSKNKGSRVPMKRGFDGKLKPALQSRNGVVMLATAVLWEREHWKLWNVPTLEIWCLIASSVTLHTRKTDKCVGMDGFTRELNLFACFLLYPMYHTGYWYHGAA